MRWTGVLGAWLWTLAMRAGGRLVIAVDGKAVRGAKGKNGRCRTVTKKGKKTIEVVYLVTSDRDADPRYYATSAARSSCGNDWRVVHVAYFAR
jgi:hypothetical protein